MNLLPLILAVILAADLAPGDHSRNLQVDGRSRTYIVRVPPKYDANQPTPVVLCFHGGGSNAEQTVRFCGLNEKADKEGFIVVYPNGTGLLNRLTFNGGNCCGYAMQNKVDDVAFVRALLDDLSKVVNVDANIKRTLS
jgi:polyhydroxybutyrate depolymerase